MRKIVIKKCLNPKCDSTKAKVSYAFYSDSYYGRHQVSIFECIKCGSRWRGEMRGDVSDV